MRCTIHHKHGWLATSISCLWPLRCTWSMNFDSLPLINYPVAKSHISSQTIPASLPIFSLFRSSTTTSAAFFPGARHHHHRREPQKIVHFFLRSMLSLDAAVAAQPVTNLPRVASKSNSVNSGGGGRKEQWGGSNGDHHQGHQWPITRFWRSATTDEAAACRRLFDYCHQCLQVCVATDERVSVVVEGCQ
uniref:Uncharacterized protein n=1 Tax=Opuntia streptacantha TaxID=393608 RepID=A0A7C9DUF4_OPUST